MVNCPASIAYVFSPRCVRLQPILRFFRRGCRAWPVLKLAMLSTDKKSRNWHPKRAPTHGMPGMWVNASLVMVSSTSLQISGRRLAGEIPANAKLLLWG